MNAGLYVEVVRPALLHLASRRRRHRVLTAASMGLAGLAVWVGMWVGLERWWVMSASGLWAGFIAMSAAAVVVAVWVNRVRGGRETLVATAAVAEGRLGLTPESLQTVVWAMERPLAGESRAMAMAVAAGAAGRLAGLDVSVSERRRTRLWACAAVLGWAVLVGAGLWKPGLLWAGVRLAVPWAMIEPPYGQRLILLPQDVDVPQGGVVQWSATLSRPADRAEGWSSGADRVPEVELSFDRETWSRLPMTPRGSAGHVARLEGVDRDVWYRGVYGSIRTPVYRVRVLTVPAVRSVDLEVVYPASLGGAVVNVGVVRDAEGTWSTAVPVGSAVRVRLAATEALGQVRVSGPGLELTTGRSTEDATAASVRLPADFTAQPSQALPLRMVLVGTRGGRSEETLVLTTLADADPVVRLLPPRSGTAVGPRDDLEMVVLGEDDAGLESGEVRLRTVRGVTTLPLGMRQSPKRWRGSVRASLPGLGLSPGETLWVSAAVRDTSGRTAVSEELALAVSVQAPDPVVAGRLAALADVSRAAMSARTTLIAAAELLGQLAELPPEGRVLSLPGARLQVAAAGDAIGRLQRSLARAVRAAPDARFADAVALLADRTVSAAVAAEAALQGSSAGNAERLRELSGRLRQVAGDLTEDIVRPVEDLRRGDAATLLVATRDGARGLIPPDDGDLLAADDAVLEATARAAATRLASLTAPVLTQPPQPLAGVLASRLELAWRMEALRPDALPQRAADLAAAAAAARQVTSTAGLVRLLAVLEAEHAATRRGLEVAGDVAAVASARTSLGELARPRDAVAAVADPADLNVLTAPAARDDPDARRAARLAELARTPRELSESLRRVARPVDSRTASSLETALRDLLRTLDTEDRAARGGAASGGGGGVSFVPAQPPPEPRIEAFRAAAVAEARLRDLEQSAVRLRELLDARARLSARPDATAADLSTSERLIAETLRELDGRAALQIRDELRRFSPELSTATVAAERTLAVALAALPQPGEDGRVGAEDLARASAGSSELLPAIGRVLAEIDTARASMTRRDPIAAARANTGAAISAVRRRDPDTALASRFTLAAAEALEAAAEQARRTRTTRLLAMLPDLMAFAAPDEAAGRTLPGNAGLSESGLTPADQGRTAVLRPPPEAVDALVGPESLRESVRTYFDLLERLPGRRGGGREGP